MKINRTQNASRNIVWGIIEKIIVLIVPFATRTVLIKTLGAEYLGLNSLFTSILSVLSITELGLGTAIVFSMYKPIAEEDDDTVCALLNAYRFIYNIIGGIIMVAGLAVLPFLPHFIKGSYPADINIYVLYLIYLGNTVIGYFLFAYKAALFSAYQRNDMASKRRMVISFCTSLAQMALLIFTRNYYVYIIVIPLSTVATNLANAYLAKKMFPNIVCRGSISKEMKDGIKKRIAGLVSFKIYNVIFTSVDTIVISAFLGLTTLAIYNNYYYIQSTIIGFLTILTASITAGIGNKMVTDSTDANYADFKKFTFANGWLCSWCSICLLCLYQHFMQWWVGSELMFTVDTMVLMVLYFLLPRLTTMTYTYREAAGLWWEDRFRPLVATVVNLVVNIILVKIIGINGVIISTLLCTIFINIPWGTIILFKNYFKRSPAEYFMKIIYYVAVTALAGGATWFVCEFVKPTGLINLIIKGLICIVVPNIIFLLFYHKTKEYSYTVTLAKRVIDPVFKKLKRGK